MLFVFFSYALFDKEGNQVPQELVTKVGDTFENVLKEVLPVCDQRILSLLEEFRGGSFDAFTNLFLLFHLLYTDLIRQEYGEDMSIKKAISMVFQRRPDLRFT